MFAKNNMSISTKSGDKGKTSLWSGERISKDDIRVEAYGTIDELDAHLAEAKQYVKVSTHKEILENIQLTLKRVMGELSSVQKKFPNPTEETDVDYLTTLVKKTEVNLKLDGFIVSGKNIASAKLDICRTVSRRAERRIISLATAETTSASPAVSDHVLSYMNRLSDLLFVLARIEEVL